MKRSIAVYSSIARGAQEGTDSAPAYQTTDAPRQRRTEPDGARTILDMISIRDRPAEAEDRAIPGHWEGDLLTGANDAHIATLVERHSRFTMLVKLPRKDTTTVV